MRTIKLNKKIQKNKKHNKTGKKHRIMQKGGSRYLEERSINKRPRRGEPTENIRVLILGTGNPAIPTYSKQKLSDDTIKEFIDEKIEVGYQIVCLPMPPDESHSIVVKLNDNDNSIMIADWGGKENRFITNKKWKNYTTFIRLLEDKYRSVTYYDVDPDIAEIACKRYKDNNGQGGCSQYVDKWIEKYIGKGEKTILYESIQ